MNASTLAPDNQDILIIIVRVLLVVFAAAKVKMHFAVNLRFRQALSSVLC